MKCVVINGANGERIEIAINGYERDANGDFHDSNWVYSIITFSLGEIRGCVHATMLTYEFVEFKKNVQDLYRSLVGQAKFETMEGQLEITLTGNGRGGIAVNGIITEKPGHGIKVIFELAIDQTYLPDIISGLSEINSKYSVRQA